MPAMFRTLRHASLLLPIIVLAGCLAGDEETELFPPEHDVSGTWTGFWSSDDYPEFDGNVTLSLQADGNAITGTVSFTGSDCFTGSLAVEGTVSGTIIKLDAENGRIRMEGSTNDGFSLSGLYAVGEPEGCEDTGSLNLSKTSGGGNGNEDLQGSWVGSWNSTPYPDFGGSLALTLQKTGTALTGSASFTGSNCFAGSMSVNGSFTGSSVFLEVGDDISFTGTHAESSLNGTYVVTGSEECEDTGTINLTKTLESGGDSVETASWSPLNSGTTSALRALRFTDTLTGYAAGTGGTILKTTDGGLSWTTLSSGTTAQLNTLFFISVSTGWAAGNGIVLKTTDAGATWTTLIEGDFMVTSIHFPDANAGYAAAGDRLLATTDGGNTWTGTEASSSGYFGGSAFQKYLIEAVFYTDASSGHIVGSATENREGIVPARGAAHRMPQGNSTVLGREQQGGTGLLSVHFPSQNVGYAAGSWGELFKTTNAGENWSLLRDGGQNPSGQTIRFLTSVYFPQIDTGFAVGALPHAILYTSNGGTSWKVHEAGTTANLYAVHCPATSTCYAAGDNGTILKYR